MFEDRKKSSFVELKRMREETFIDLSNIKVAPLTQLPLLCEAILSRKIVVNTL